MRRRLVSVKPRVRTSHQMRKGPFPSCELSITLPVPPLTSNTKPAHIPIQSWGSSSSDKKNSSPGSFESTQEVMGPLVEIQEVDPEVDDKDACELFAAMDREVRSCLFQHCKSKRHPQRFAPFPKGWKVDRAREQRRTFHPQIRAEHK